MIDSQPMTFFERHGRWGFPLLIALLCLAAYANSFHGAYVFDDLDSITNNQSIRHLWPLWPVLMPPWTEETFMTVSGRPLINLSLALNYAVRGEDVVGYHVVNLLIHVLAAWTLFGFCRRTLLLPRLGEKINAHATTLAGIVAMLWALHPLQTESVTYVVQRAESIAGLFYLLTLYCLCRSATAPRPAAWSVLTVTCCLLGMASKETMATAPIVALVYDRLLLSDSFREILRRRWKLYAGCFASLGLLAALMISSGGRAGTAGTVEGLTAWEYARSQFGVIAHYLRLCFWPDKLALDYGWPIAYRFMEIVPPALLILALLAGTVLLLLRKHKEAAMLGAWFFIILAPSSSIVPITDLAFEHRMYLALAAVVAAVVLAAFYLLGRLHSAPARRAVGIALVSVACLAMIGRIHMRNKDYDAPLRLWEATVADTAGMDNSRAHLNYGLSLENVGRLDEAMTQFNIAIQQFPTHPGARNNRGMLLMRLGRTQEALADFTKSIEIKNDGAAAYANRANAYSTLGQQELALLDAEKAVALDPKSAQPFDVRGTIYQSMGRLDEALADYEHALQLDPKYALGYSNRCAVLARRGRLEEALADATKAIELKGDLLDARMHRAGIYARMGKLDLALQDYDKLLQLKPNSADVYFNRSNTYYQNGRLDEALADLQKVVSIDSRKAEAYNNLADVYLRLGKTPEAIAAADKAIEVQPNSAFFHLTRAEVRMATKEYDGAWKDVRRGRELGQDFSPDLLQKLQKASGRKE